MTFDIADKMERIQRSADETDPAEYMPAMAQASQPKPEPKTYLHIGHGRFDPKKVSGKDETSERHDKPYNALYGSEYIPEGEEYEVLNEEYDPDIDDESKIMTKIKAYSDWDRYTQSDWPEAGSDTGFTYQLKPEARVYRFRGLNDLKKMPMKYWKPDLHAIMNQRFPDWFYPRNREKAEKIWDQIMDELQTGKLSVEDESVPLMLNYGQLAQDYDALDFGNAFGYSELNEGTYSPDFKKVRWKGRTKPVGRYSLPVFDAGQSMVFNPKMITNVKPWTRPYEPILRSKITDYSHQTRLPVEDAGVPRSFPSLPEVPPELREKDDDDYSATPTAPLDARNDPPAEEVQAPVKAKPSRTLDDFPSEEKADIDAAIAQRQPQSRLSPAQEKRMSVIRGIAKKWKLNYKTIPKSVPSGEIDDYIDYIFRDLRERIDRQKKYGW